MRTTLALSLTLAMGLLAAPNVRADDAARATVEKAVKAAGGLDLLAKYSAAKMKHKGSVEVMGQTFEYAGDFIHQLPDQYKMDLTMEVMGQKIQVVQVLNKDKGWMSAAGMSNELMGDQLAHLKDECYANHVGSLVPLLKDKDKKFTLTSVGEANVNGKPAVGVKVSSKGHKDINLYFDKESGLLVKTERRATDFSGNEIDSEAFFSDYKETMGIKQPMKLVLHHDKKKFLESETLEIKFFEKLEETEFGKP